jgi:hypothetical protein
MCGHDPEIAGHDGPKYALGPNCVLKINLFVRWLVKMKKQINTSDSQMKHLTPAMSIRLLD